MTSKLYYLDGEVPKNETVLPLYRAMHITFLISLMIDWLFDMALLLLYACDSKSLLSSAVSSFARCCSRLGPQYRTWKHRYTFCRRKQ